MSVLIKGMEMPVRCSGCDMEINYEYLYHECVLLYKGYTNDIRYFGRLKNCPLAEIPQKHGDLIDRDELKKAVFKWLPSDPCGVEEKERPFETDICVSMMQEIEEQTAVIKAEGVEE